MPGIWFPMLPAPGGHHQALLGVQLELNGRLSFKHQFIVDTGASVSLAPLNFARRLLDDAEYARLKREPLTSMGLRDASGGWLTGHAMEVIVHVPRLGEVTDTLWFSPAFAFGLLGLSRWFEQVGAKFENFPKSEHGRRFALHHAWR